MNAIAPSTSNQDFQLMLQSLRERFAAMQPELEVTLRDPSMDVEAYVVVWNTGISIGGPLERMGKGGTRILPTLSLDEMKMLARTMALKNAAAGLPLGGAKSGIRADSSAPGFEEKYRRFVSMCKPFLFENGGVFGGFGFDIGGRPEHALWACDELGSTRSFTGKPLDMGGTDYDRLGIAGLGVAAAARAMLQAQGKDASGTSFAVQGLGAMGAAVVHYFAGFGGRLDYIGDPRYGGTWHFARGASAEFIAALFAQDMERVRALLAIEAQCVDSDPGAVLLCETDILFPCAVQEVLTGANADKVRANAVVEGANGPCTPEARTIMHERGITVIPDFIANPGGIIAAFVEMTMTQGDKAQAACDMTRTRIAANVAELMDIVEKQGVSPADAGLYLALTRMFAA